MKSLVLKFARDTLGAPTLWLGIGVAALCASFTLSYLRAQVEADYAMTLRVGPPDAVDIAEVVPGASGEGHLIARFDPERAVTVRVGPAGARSDWRAVPLFAIGDVAQPVSDGSEPRLERAAGLAVFPVGGPGPEALLADGATVFEGAINGPLLALEAFGLDTAATLAEAGIALPADFVAIEPWTAGRATALEPEPAGPYARYLLWSGIAFILLAAGLSLRPEENDRYLTLGPTDPERKVVTKSRIMADTDRFNPLIGQDDIRRGAMERLHASERAQGRTPSTFFTSGAAKVGAGWVRNRR